MGPRTKRRRSGFSPVAMMLRRPFRPLRPEFDKFLFATVGDEIDGIPISVVSALARLGLDPREEAGRLSSLGNREAVEQLARLIAEVPGSFRPLGEARLLEDGREGFVATISQRDDMGKVVGRPSVVPVSSKEEAKQQAKTLARSLGLKVYGIIDKTDAGGSPSSPQVDSAEIVGSDIDYTKTNEVQPPCSVPGAEKSL